MVHGPAQAQLREHAVETVRPLRNVFEQQDRVVPRRKAYGVPAAAANCVNVPPSSRPRASPGLIACRPVRRQLAQRCSASVSVAEE